MISTPEVVREMGGNTLLLRPFQGRHIPCHTGGSRSFLARPPANRCDAFGIFSILGEVGFSSAVSLIDQEWSNPIPAKLWKSRAIHFSSAAVITSATRLARNSEPAGW